MIARLNGNPDKQERRRAEHVSNECSYAVINPVGERRHQKRHRR